MLSHLDFTNDCFPIRLENVLVDVITEVHSLLTPLLLTFGREGFHARGVNSVKLAVLRSPSIRRLEFPVKLDTALFRVFALLSEELGCEDVMLVVQRNINPSLTLEIIKRQIDKVI